MEHFDLENKIKERQERVKKIELSEEYYPAINYESEKIYQNLLLVRDMLKEMSFVNSWKPIEVFFNIIQERIEESREIDRKVYYDYKTGGDLYSKDTPNKYILRVEPICLYKRLGWVSYTYSVDIDIIEDSFDSNEFIRALINRIESLSSQDIYDFLEYKTKYIVEEHKKDGVFSLLSVKHINRLFKLQDNARYHPYLGESEIQLLNNDLVKENYVGKKLVIERTKNFVSGRNALIVKLDNELMGYLPDDFGLFLCPGIEAGYIKFEAKITEIESDTFKATKKCVVAKKNTSQKKNDGIVRVVVIPSKGDRV